MLSNSKRPKKQPTGDYSNGYARPPKDHQIKPGEVRNPWGPKGKPRPTEVDPFEFAANQPVTVNIGGTDMQVTAEQASYLKNMAMAVAGDQRAHKNVVDSRRSRCVAQPPGKTADELLRERDEEQERRRLSGRLVENLELIAQAKHLGILMSSSDGSVCFVPELSAAIREYRERHGDKSEPACTEE